VHDALERLDPTRPVYVESESRRIGTVQLPDALLATMRAGECVFVATPDSMRVALLKDEYAHFLADPALLAERLDRLVERHGRKTVERWAAAAAAGDWDSLIGELLVQHYDPLYRLSLARNFPNAGSARVHEPEGVGEGAFRAVARDVERGAKTSRDASALPA
jgi:tRNA 2-selenouridine synthase